MKTIKIALSHIRRSPYQSLLVVMVLSFAFFLISSFATLSFISQKVLTFFESQPQVIAYLKDSAEEEEIDDLVSRLEATGKIDQGEKGIKILAPHFWKEEDREGNEKERIGFHVTNVFDVSQTDGESLAEQPNWKSPEKNRELQNKLIDFAESIADSLRDWTQAIRRVGLGGGALLVVQTLLLMIVVTSMKIALRKDEVEILKLLGASSWQTRSPFLVEGIIYGLWGAVFGFGGMYLALTQLGQALIGFSFFADIGVFPVDQNFLLLLLGGVAFFSSFICGLGSYIATRRYLR